MSDERPGQTFVYELPQSYIDNGYLFIKEAERPHFPEPPVTLSICFNDMAVAVPCELKETSQERWRIYGLRDWYTESDAVGGDRIAVTVMEPKQQYRLTIEKR